MARLGSWPVWLVNTLNHLANGVTIEGPIPEEVCGPCMMGRQHRKINRTPRTRATEFLGLVHSDLGGPFPLTRFGERFYATIKDDFSGVVWVYLLKTKGQTFEIFKEFKAWIENQSGKNIKRLRADGGGEYTGRDFQSFLKKEGIQWEARAPNVPEQNGKAERQNYTLMVPTRSMLKAKKLPKSLWGEVLKTAGYIKNRSPGVDEVTPYERMNNAKPFLGHMRTVGARTWVHIPKEKRKKLDDRSWQGIFVGYDGNNQYRIYDPLTGKVHVCRDITVDEGNIYDPKDRKAWDLADIPWEKNDDGLFDDPDDFVENEVEIPNSLSPINPNSKISRSSEDQQVSAPSTPRIMLHPMGVNASGGGQAEESEGEDDPSETEEIPSPLIEPRRSGRIRVPSQRELENIRPSIQNESAPSTPRIMLHPMGVNTSGGGQAEESEGEDDPSETEEIPSPPIEPRRAGRIRVPSQRELENIRPSIQNVSAPSTPRIMLYPMGVYASGVGQVEENEGEDDPSETEEIPSPPIEPRRAGRIRVPSQRTLENIRPSINTDEENGGEIDSDEVEDIPRQPIEPRRSGRIRVPSQRTLENIRPSINTVFSSNQVPKSHEHMVRVLATLAGGEDNEGFAYPLTLKEAMSSPHWDQWRKAMETEYQSLVENETWTLERAPTDRKVITGRWLLKNQRCGRWAYEATGR